MWPKRRYSAYSIDATISVSASAYTIHQLPLNQHPNRQ